MKRWYVPWIAGVAATCAIAAFSSSTGKLSMGPSTAVRPYMVPTQPGVEIVSLLTVGESATNGYRMVGIPDGMGAYDNGDGTITFLSNHELSSSAGIARAHGAAGALVSEWVMDKETLEIISGTDLIQTVLDWDPGTQSYIPSPSPALARFCSGTLAEPTAYWNPDTGMGTQALIYNNGEEAGANGRPYAHIASGPAKGTTYEMAWLGNMSWENVNASPLTGDTTVVAGLDDATAGQVFFYYGQKTNVGNDIRRAGLEDGDLYGLSIVGLPPTPGQPQAGWGTNSAEDRDTGLLGAESRRFELINLGDVAALNGNQLEAAADAANVTGFFRPEDGHWHPTRANDYIFTTTGSSGAPGRLWRVRFDDIQDPTQGGWIDMLLDGTEGTQRPDNLVVTETNHVLIQEDPGGSSLLCRIWQYDLVNDKLFTVAQANPDFFESGQPEFLTTNEESTGILDAREFFGDGWYLYNLQVHLGDPDPELVEGGQYMMIYVPTAAFGTGDMNCDGVISVGDINPFVLAITDPAGYAKAFPECDLMNADTSGDDAVSVSDINRFVELVSGDWN